MTRVTLWFESALLPDGWAQDVRIVLDGAVIGRIEKGVAPASGDARHGVALPGLGNLHSHAFQRGMAGLAEVRGPSGDSFWTWREVMYRFVDRLDPETMQAIAELAYIEMLESGFTRVGEFHYLHHDKTGVPYANLAEMSEHIAAAAQSTGIALTLLPVFYAHSDFGAREPAQSQRRFLNDPTRFAKLIDACRAAVRPLQDAVVGIAPHSLRAVTPEELREIVPLAKEAPIHIHGAEQKKEVDDCVAWSGARPVEWLLDNAGIDARWCLVHATHMTEVETGRLAQSGAVAGLCPITEANLGDGIFPAPAFLNHGGRFGVGTDSNVRIGVAEELRLLEYGQRLNLTGRNILAAREGESTGRALFDAALRGGFQALGVSRFGLTPGAPADIVSLNAADPDVAGRQGDQVLDSWVFARARVDGVWRRGKKLVTDGRHHSRDAVVTRYKQAVSGIVG